MDIINYIDGVNFSKKNFEKIDTRWSLNLDSIILIIYNRFDRLRFRWNKNEVHPVGLFGMVKALNIFLVRDRCDVSDG